MKIEVLLCVPLLAVALLGQDSGKLREQMMAGHFEFSIDAAERSITVINHHPTASIVGFYLRGKPDDIHKLFTGNEAPIAPESRWKGRLALMSEYVLEAALWTDGSIEGPNNWGLDKHLQAYLDMGAGKPVYEDGKRGSESGTSYVWIRRWANAYEEEFHIKPVVKDAGGRPPSSLPPGVRL